MAIKTKKRIRKQETDNYSDEQSKLLNCLFTNKDLRSWISIILTIGLLYIAYLGVNQINEINTNLNEFKALTADIDSLTTRIATIENLSTLQIRTNTIEPNCPNGTSVIKATTSRNGMYWVCG